MPKSNNHQQSKHIDTFARKNQERFILLDQYATHALQSDGLNDLHDLIVALHNGFYDKKSLANNHLTMKASNGNPYNMHHQNPINILRDMTFYIAHLEFRLETNDIPVAYDIESETRVKEINERARILNDDTHEHIKIIADSMVLEFMGVVLVSKVTDQTTDLLLRDAFTNPIHAITLIAQYVAALEYEINRINKGRD